jgi:hypothetical protein
MSTDKIKVMFQIKSAGFGIRVWSREEGEFETSLQQEPFYSVTKTDRSASMGAQAQMRVCWPVHEIQMDRDRFQRLKARAEREAAKEKQ